MEESRQVDANVELPTEPNAVVDGQHEAYSADQHTDGSVTSSRSGSEHDLQSRGRLRRPKLLTRKSSGTMVVPRDSATIELKDEDYDDDDARAMSPKRNSEEIDKLEEAARQALIDQAKQLQESLLSIVERVESVKSEHEKLEGGNQFLQSYIGELMQTSKITSTTGKGKGKARNSK